MEKKRFQKIYIEIINTCNMKCSFCKKTNRAPRVIKIEEFEYIISKIKSYTNLIALHVKGEPLMHPHLKDILKICEKYEMLVNLTTNGTLLLENIDILKRSRALRQINISLHSMNKNEEQPLKSKEKYIEDIFEAVKILQKNNNPYISYRLWNLKNISENEENTYILEFLEKVYGAQNLVEQAKENEFINLADKIFLNQDIEFSWPDLNKKELNHNGTCLGLRNQIAILCNGDVVPCCLDQDADIKLGNIFSEELEKILNSEKSLEIIKGFEENRFVHKLCKTCGFPSKFNNRYWGKNEKGKKKN